MPHLRITVLGSALGYAIELGCQGLHHKKGAFAAGVSRLHRIAAEVNDNVLPCLAFRREFLPLLAVYCPEVGFELVDEVEIGDLPSFELHINYGN